MKMLMSLLIGLLSYPMCFGICTGTFGLYNDMIVVEGMVDGIEGNFILDTGAPGLVLNSQYFSGIPSEHEILGLNGGSGVLEQHIEKFRWKCIEKEGIQSIVVDLQYLETALEIPILGLIGYELIRNHELVIDYPSRTIEHRTLLSTGEIRTEYSELQLPFTLTMHLPVMEVKLQGRTGQLIVDTGSEDNFLDISLLDGDIDEDGKCKLLINMNKEKKRVHREVIPLTSIKGNVFINMEFLVMDFHRSKVNERISADGILGFPALKRFRKFSINYQDRMILLWK